MMNDSLLEIAQIGKVVGLKGDLKFHDRSDFPDQFKKGAVFTTHKGTELTVAAFNAARSQIRFVGFDSRESAQALTNTLLYTTKEATRENCDLEEGEFFWFDVEGCAVYEKGQLLGIVEAIDRIAETDYLYIKTDKALTDQKMSASFLIPYVDRFIEKADIKNKRIDVIDGLSLLEAS
jgi:16S rRNA processing protein RimM